MHLFRFPLFWPGGSFPSPPSPFCIHACWPVGAFSGSYHLFRHVLSVERFPWRIYCTPAHGQWASFPGVELQLNSFEGRWSEFNFFRLLMSPRPCCRLAAHITPARRPRPRAGSIAFLPLPFYYRGSLAACASGWISPFRAPFRGIQSRSGTTGWVLLLFRKSSCLPLNRGLSLLLFSP